MNISIRAEVVRTMRMLPRAGLEASPPAPGSAARIADTPTVKTPAHPTPAVRRCMRQGYLAHRIQPPPRALQRSVPRALRWSQRRGNRLPALQTPPP